MESKIDQSLANSISSEVYTTYSKLPKKGKPQKNKEWSLISAVVIQLQDKEKGISCL